MPRSGDERTPEVQAVEELTERLRGDERLRGLREAVRDEGLLLPDLLLASFEEEEGHEFGALVGRDGRIFEWERDTQAGVTGFSLFVQLEDVREAMARFPAVRAALELARAGDPHASALPDAGEAAADRGRARFLGELERAARARFQASCEGQEPQALVDLLLDRYLSAGSPEPIAAWLEAALSEVFLWVAEPPRWVGEEPCWPFFEGRPMIFIHQMSLPRNAVTEGHLAPDVELYLFGARIPIQSGYLMEYRIVEQEARPGGRV